MEYSTFFFSQHETSWRRLFYLNEKTLITLGKDKNEKQPGKHTIKKDRSEISLPEALEIVSEELLSEQSAQLEQFYSEYGHLEKPALTSWGELTGVSFMQVPGKYGLVTENIIFYTTETIYSFEFPFFSRFKGNSAHQCFSQFYELVTQVLNGGAPQKVDMSYVIAFDEYFFIEQEKSHYFGIIDNEYAYKPQRNFSMDTRDLCTVLEMFLTRFCPRE